MGILLKTQLFSDLDAAVVAELEPCLRERRFARGQVVWFEGDPSDGVWVLAEGELKSHRISPEGGDVIMEFNRAVDTVGEIGAFYPGGFRQVSVTALTNAFCLVVPRTPLEDVLARHRPAMVRMLERMSTIAVRGASAYSNLAFLEVRGRVASALLALADEFGEPRAHGVEIALTMSQGTLASLVAASRENVNRALAGFISSGAITQNRGRFTLHEPAMLRAMLNPSAL